MSKEKISPTGPERNRKENPHSLADFLRLFFADTQPVCFRAFPPKGVGGEGKLEYGTIREFEDESSLMRKALHHLNKDRGIYFVVNSGGNSDRDITRFNAVFMEDDVRTIEEQHARLDDCPLPTTARVETGKSVHAYWKLTGDVDPDRWDQAMLGVIAYFDSDKSIKNRSRVMRVPGFDHISKDGTRKPVRCVQFNPDRAYSIDTILAKFPPQQTRKETRKRKSKDDPDRVPPLSVTKDMLAVISSDDRNDWRNIGIILGRSYNRSDDCWQAYVDWSNKWIGNKERDHDETMWECFHKTSQETIEGKMLSFGTIRKLALDHGWTPKDGEVPISDFLFSAEGNNFIYKPVSAPWLASVVDSCVSKVNENGELVPASEWLKKNRRATSFASNPRYEEFVKNFNCFGGVIIPSPGGCVYNKYRRPVIEPGDATKAQPYIDHAYKLLNKPGDADQVLDYLAFLVQKPEEKIRWALLIGGPEGSGKDTLIEMACYAIGHWNVSNIGPEAFESGFNEYEASTLIRINEASQSKDMSRWAFHERTKVLIAGNPDHADINPKYGMKFSVIRRGGVIMTTNHMLSGIHIPPGDRRYDVIETATLTEMQLPTDQLQREYFAPLWEWFNKGGSAHVAAFLNERDISKFSAAKGQRKTAAHRAVVALNMPNDEWLSDVIYGLGEPDGVRFDWVMAKVEASGKKPKDADRQFLHAMGRLDYVPFVNPKRADGRWTIDERLRKVYVKVDTPPTYNPEEELTAKKLAGTAETAGPNIKDPF